MVKYESDSSCQSNNTVRKEKKNWIELSKQVVIEKATERKKEKKKKKRNT